MTAARNPPSAKAPWKKPPPKGAKHTVLSPAKKTAAKARAKRAGRPYPNLVDNMHAASGDGADAKKKTAKRSTAKKTAKRSTAKKTAKRGTAKKTAKRSTAKKSAAKKTAKRGAAKKTAKRS